MAEIDMEDPVNQAAVLGKIVEDWLETDIGQYLMSKADELERENTEQVVQGLLAMNQVQMNMSWTTIHCARFFKKWLRDAVAQYHQIVAIKEGDQDE